MTTLSQTLIDGMNSDSALDNHGMVSNTATVSAEDSGGIAVPCKGGSCSSSATCSWPLIREIGIILSDDYLHRVVYEGDAIKFSYKISNEGRTTLNSVSLDTSSDATSGIVSEFITMDDVSCHIPGSILSTPGNEILLLI